MALCEGDGVAVRERAEAGAGCTTLFLFVRKAAGVLNVVSLATAEEAIPVLKFDGETALVAAVVPLLAVATAAEVIACPRCLLVGASGTFGCVKGAVVDTVSAGTCNAAAGGDTFCVGTFNAAAGDSLFSK